MKKGLPEERFGARGYVAIRLEEVRIEEVVEK